MSGTEGEIEQSKRDSRSAGSKVVVLKAWVEIGTDDTHGMASPEPTSHSCRTVSRTGVRLATASETYQANRRLTEYQVIGRHLPTDANPAPKLYRMRIFATNSVVAKSRFWYFLMKLRKVKKANGEIVSLNVIHEKRPQKVKNFGIWIRYDSRSGTHNMYKEYREMSRTDAVEALYQDMAARHRSRFRSIHILKVVELEKTDDVKRPYIKQLLTKDLKFPLPHRVSKSTGKKIFSGSRPSTFY
ncbi:60S ribosomal protein L20 [Drepanopeziza brunnea f. sp. 'multigermtubi' MB_m1]|uniref:60S ribosomal protein L20 n=1 Tax=Marssonina brunnea f. sp. multigermtubi (strain MB_m1) TaxID=1072389 RepID=K1XI33_MARBU|nr:60S ribosomal protein L20 [Drepanopeziza brunnea f. sp. 'multigermtubi' MB_m1]EKD12094.1 60S ribosomal protein L20 [Drepanopeziza brunnea f. sp. 'multigermtubi' MB_m1]